VARPPARRVSSNADAGTGDSLTGSPPTGVALPTATLAVAALGNALRPTDRTPGPSVCDPDAFRALTGETPTDLSLTPGTPPGGAAHAGTKGNTVAAITNANTRHARREKPE
jgi:hypothetical protein